MSDQRREHNLTITLNKRRFDRVVIDPHYEINHPDMTDKIVLELIKQLDASETEPVAGPDNDGFVYLAKELLWHSKTYRIVLTYCEESFLGVINAFRVKKEKKS